MSFIRQTSIGGSVTSQTSPATISFKGKLYVFYLSTDTSSRKTSLWCNSTSAIDARWDGARNLSSSVEGVELAIIPSSPAAVVYLDRIFVFWYGLDSKSQKCIRFAGFNGIDTWTPTLTAVGSVNIGNNPIPSLAVFDSLLYLFWTASDSTVSYKLIDDHGVPGEQTFQFLGNGGVPVVVAQNTSPKVFTFGDKLYIFWGNPDPKNSDVMFATSSAPTKGWDQPFHSLLRDSGSTTLRFKANTSVTVIPYNNHDTGFRVVWTGDSSNPDLWNSKFNGTKWTQEFGLASDGIGSHTLSPQSSGSGCVFGLTPYIFWVGTNNDIWFSKLNTYDMLDPTSLKLESSKLNATNEFVASSAEPFILNWWTKYINTPYSIAPTTESPKLDATSLVRAIYGNTSVQSGELFGYAWLQALLVTALGLGYHIESAVVPHGPVDRSVDFLEFQFFYVGT